MPTPALQVRSLSRTSAGRHALIDLDLDIDLDLEPGELAGAPVPADAPNGAPLVIAVARADRSARRG